MIKSIFRKNNIIIFKFIFINIFSEEQIILLEPN